MCGGERWKCEGKRGGGFAHGQTARRGWRNGPTTAPLPPSQVIARTSGRCLGVVDHMYIDPATLRVASLDLRATGLAAAAGLASGAASEARPRNLPLATLCQVGDVALVHDERALGFAPLDERAGCVRLTGLDVVAADGAPLGRVRGYAFDPETGDLLALRYDALGAPRVPEGAMTVWEVAAGDVLNITRATITLRPGAEYDALKISDGLLGLALAGLQALVDGSGGGGFDSSDALADTEFAAWREVHGTVFARYYGLPSVPRSRSELDAAMAGVAAATAEPVAQRSAPVPRARRRAALPPPTPSRAYADALVENERREYERAYDEVPRRQEGARRQEQAFGGGGDPRSRSRRPAGTWPPPPPVSDEGYGYGDDGNANDASWLEPPREAGWGAGPDARRAPSPPARPAATTAPAPPSPPKQGIPIIDRRLPPPDKVRDADGGFGGRKGEDDPLARWSEAVAPAAPTPAAAAAAPVPVDAVAGEGGGADGPPTELKFGP